MPDKLLDLKNDLVFQRLFGNPKNKEITGHLLSLILKREIYNIDLDANKTFLGDAKDSKTVRLDVRAKFNNGEQCNIELQVQPFKYMENRMLDYWANMYTSKIEIGQGYEELKPSISILITNYKVDKAKEISHYHSIWDLRERNHKDLKLTNDIELHILEMPKVNDIEMENDELAQWLKLIADPESEEVRRIMEDNEYFKKAMEAWEFLSGDEDLQRRVFARTRFLMDQATEKAESKAEGLAEGRSKGRAEGEASKAKQIAKKMKAKNMPIEEIVELTGLTEEEINEERKKYGKKEFEYKDETEERHIKVSTSMDKVDIIIEIIRKKFLYI